jgi:hypothetical protein
MDPLSALGIAAAAVQFLQFASSLVSKSHQIYTQGALVDHVECANATRRLSDLVNGVQQSLDDLGTLGDLSEGSKALKVICARCVKISEELSCHLNDLQAVGKHKKWESLRQPLRAVCSRDKIDDLARKLASGEKELNLHLMVTIRYFLYFTSPGVI